MIRTVHRCRRSSADAPGLFETLEPRILLSAATASTLYPLAILPNESGISSPQFSDQWYLQNTGQTLSSHPSGPASGTPGADIGAVNAWNLTTGSRNVVVAVFDTGVDLTHPDLQNNIWHNPGEIPGNGIDDDHDGFVDDVNGWNFVDGNNNVQDTSFTGHGTLVSGVIGAQGNNGIGIAGVNWNVTLLPVKVGTDTGVTSQSLQAGISYVETLKARGVNIVAINASYISFGIPSLSDINAIASTANYGMLYIAAAGNSGLNFDSFLPGGYLPSNMILVAATDNQDHLASFSDYGAGSVALGAPGVDILTTVRGGGYGMFSGTSFAGPMVSGTAALLKAYAPGASMDQIRNALLTGATPDPFLAGKTITGKRLNAYGALQVLVGNRAPIGSLDSLSSAGASGWAFDYNGGVVPVAVAVLIDGKFAAAAYAATARADLAAAFGSAGHAYAFGPSVFANLAPGNHLVQLYAVDIRGAGPQLPAALIGSRVLLGPQPPIGHIDLFNVAAVAGWAIDLNTPNTAVNLRIDVDGHTVGTPAASISRPDLQRAFGSAAHGFAFALPATLSLGFHRVDLYAQDTTTLAYTYLGSQEINTNASPIGSIDRFIGLGAAGGVLLQGWAQDPNAPAAAIQIRYQIDDNAPVLATAGDRRSDLQARLGSQNHAFNIVLPQLPAGNHTVTAWAVDPATQSLTLLGVRTAAIASPAGNPLPIGRVEVATATRIIGWAYDASTPFAPIRVRIDVDGVPGTPFTASVRRDDLTPTLRGPSFGYDQAFTLSAGPHRVDVYALDAATQTPVLLGSRIIGNSTPTAAIATLSAATASGTAVLPATPSTPAQVLLTINGAPAVLATANGSHQFSITLPHLLPGTYVLGLSVIDPVTLAPTLVDAAYANITLTNQV